MNVVSTEPEPVCRCGVAKHEYKNHEYFCPVSMKERGMPWQPLDLAAWELERARIDSEIELLRKKLSDHKFRCTHKTADGVDMRQPCGGGDTFCYTCRQQFD